jgi:serine O-acetyltransferase
VTETRRIESFAALCALWREDFATHDRALLVMPGLHTLAVHRFGVWADGLPGRRRRWLLLRLHGLLAFWSANRSGIELPIGARIGRRVKFPHRGGTVLHGSVRVGDDCLVRQNVTLGVSGRRREGGPTLGDRVEIGAGAVIVGPVRIGDDARIGPNVVVQEDVPAGATVRPHRPEIRPRPAPGDLGTDG